MIEVPDAKKNQKIIQNMKLSKKDTNIEQSKTKPKEINETADAMIQSISFEKYAKIRDKRNKDCA
jgi:hypothetical protein